MNWLEIREAYPDQWLIIEALEAHTAPDHQRLLEHIAVIERCANGNSALERYYGIDLKNLQICFSI